jgi:hypothetical protein
VVFPKTNKSDATVRVPLSNKLLLYTLLTMNLLLLSAYSAILSVFKLLTLDVIESVRDII